ncbi:MBL fold metallo-hydrolase [Periweissella fabalis]|uniref:MBL fold metallo-hydrolase n=1 Tax=Periweissella fabalis TaxID=1070421 RepID=A0A7X6N460_9LACO|nr:MBL fold metallo-hydrolase [Periweissella fabalis]MCM0598171.1 MBL fold metallo-hydrolase [Periweissella fabalis]NKZ24705.1 MBL fold metallo-hydrolase [Periweissella fabalis]
MTKVRFLSGLTTIGANVVEISTATSRVLMDFGSTENIANMPALETMFKNHSIPDSPDLFALNSSSQYAHEAIFISHLHLDHTGALPLLNTDIPVYFSSDSNQLYKALVSSGLSFAHTLNIHTFLPNVPICIGDLTITGLPSDHDILGINALLVFDGTHRFAHSGDFRLNGFHPELVQNWAKTLSSLQIDVFLTETTSFSFPDTKEQGDFDNPLTEYQLLNKFAHIIKESSLLPVINCYERNIERILAFNNTSYQQLRPIVWEYQFAKLINLLKPTEPLLVLAESIPNDTSLIQATPVSIAEITAKSDKYCLHSTFANRKWLTALPPIHYLHSNGSPLGAYDPNYQVLRDYLATINAKYEYFGCSGHATPTDIIDICKKVNAKLTIPWHSFHPELFVSAFKDNSTLLPQYDEIYEFN